MLRRMNHDDRTSLPAAVICATVSLWALGSSLLGAPRDAGEAVREVTIAKLATAKAGARIPTHVRLSGVVGSVRHEADRDYHISLCVRRDRSWQASALRCGGLRIERQLSNLRRDGKDLRGSIVVSC